MKLVWFQREAKPFGKEALGLGGTNVEKPPTLQCARFWGGWIEVDITKLKN